MRPLYHPPISELTVQGVMFALSDPVRVRIFSGLVEAEGRNCTTFLNIGDISLPKSSLSQHFKVLRECGLIKSERHGVEVKNYTRCDELRSKFGELIPAILKAYKKEIRL
jgi:DNA-binding transcriptional ArsR family regulator